MGTTNRKLTKVTGGKQRDLFGGDADAQASPRIRSGQGRVFVAPDPRDIYLGSQPLEAHLREAGINEPLTVRRLLQEQDWSAFESRYARTGRAPYAPSAMMGLVLYGMLQGVTSLRGLERLARRDLGCMWVTGGISPDHANIARFIALHDDLIAGPFFEALTRSVLRETGSSGESLAGDGTVVEAAASHYGLLKAEATQQKAEETQRQAQDDPDDPDKQRQAEHARHVHETLEHRGQRRQARGKSSGQLRISPQEPDALVQPLKRGRGMAPAYKPSILANESRVVVGHAVDPSNEVAVLPGLLTQSQKVTGAMPGELLLDAGYWADAVIETSLIHDISLLCPEGRTGRQKPAGNRLYPKSDFRYNEFDDSYCCPAGARMNVIGRWAGNEKSPAYTLYGTPACDGCDHRRQCTRNKKGRRLKRYEGDEAKEALRQVMRHPEAKRRFSRRQAMVEPVFSVLRGLQGLSRFRRKGLAAVRTEFALHVLTYNLGRALAYRRLLQALISGYTAVLVLFLLYFVNRRFIDVIMSITTPNPGKAAHANPTPALA